MGNNANPLTVRFKVGTSYLLRSSPDIPQMLGGFLTVRSEIKPTDLWGNRIVLADCSLLYPDGHTETRLSARCFIEEGFAIVRDSYGERTVPAEIANVQGVYPNFAKAYAVDGVAVHKEVA